jgi:DNA replication protein DnaC
MKHQTESLEHASVRQYCRAVRVPTIGANFLSLAEQAVKENHSHIRYLEALLAIECEERDRHAINNRIRDAQLPRMKTLEEFDFTQAPPAPLVSSRAQLSFQVPTCHNRVKVFEPCADRVIGIASR